MRADIDGLPIEEQNEVSYRSENSGVMHACGHDGHISIALGLAATLAARRAELPGTVKFVFQPAEEIGSGAQPMLAAGVLNDPEVDAVIGLHLWNNLPAGQLGVCNGPIFAAVDMIEITVKGRGGHGALPHQTVDALLVGAQIVTTLQTVVSRECPPDQSAVVTVGSFHSGSASNIINGEAHLRVSLRSTTPAARDFMMSRVQELAQGVAHAFRAECEFLIRRGVPPVVNDANVAEAVRRGGRSAVGAANVVEVKTTTISDDMAYFLEAKPGCYFLMGSATSSNGNLTAFPHHHPRFDLDEACLVPAVEILAHTILELS
jgi:amidohydrolase